ncbi:ENV2 protein, partial [Pardalotus punctatus]|nr:ENV2 protein [Pardalotus punctatus]
DSNNLWKLVKNSYYVLNATNPNLTEHCWLCYSSKPPFYEAIAINGREIRTNDSNPTQCKWRSDLNIRAGITLAQVTGTGTC